MCKNLTIPNDFAIINADKLKNGYSMNQLPKTAHLIKGGAS